MELSRPGANSAAPREDEDVPFGSHSSGQWAESTAFCDEEKLAISYDADEKSDGNLVWVDVPTRGNKTQDNHFGDERDLAPVKTEATKQHEATERGSDVDFEATSLVHKLLLTSQLLGNEASINFLELYSVPNLQLLGMPLNLVPLAPAVLGPTGLVLLPLLGWFSDRGSDPRRRKMFTGLTCMLLLTSGVISVVMANVLHIQSYVDMIHSDNTSFTALSPLVPASQWTNTSHEFNVSHIPDTPPPFRAWLAMAGYMQVDMAFDLSNSFVKTWVLTCSSRPEHATLLMLGTLMSSVGGLFISSLSMFDLQSALFGDHMAGVSLAVQALALLAIVLFLALAGGAFTIIVGYRQLHRDKRNRQAGEGKKKHHGNWSVETKARVTMETPLLQDKEDPDISFDDSSAQKPRQVYGSCTPTLGSEEPSPARQTSARGHPASNQKPQAPDNARGGHVNYKRELVLNYMNILFAYTLVITFCMLSTDYVGKAIYGGDPEAEPGSDSLRKYQTGVRRGSVGFIVYYGSYLLGSACHKHAYRLLGHRLEYSLVFLSGSVSLVTLALTARIEIFFVVCVVGGIQRACLFIIPFVVTNDIIQAQAARTGKTGGANLGFAISMASSMAPLSYCTLYPCTIALEHATGLLSLPVWICAACGCLATLFFLLLKKV